MAISGKVTVTDEVAGGWDCVSCPQAQRPSKPLEEDDDASCSKAPLTESEG